MKRKVHSSFIDNIWSADLANMQLIRQICRYAVDKTFRFLLCAIDIYSEYVWVIPVKDKKVITITNSFQNILNKSKR